MLRIAGRLLLSLLIVLNQLLPASAYGYAVPEDQRIAYETSTKNLESYIRFLQELRRTVDRSQFDTDALIDKLDYELDPIIKFVTREIDFEQYAGLLRGAQGTLLSGSGSALDQSVLLATLIRDAGFEARIAFANLSSSQANKLLQQINSGPVTLRPIGDEAEIERIIRKYALKAGWSNQEFDAWETSFNESGNDSYSSALNSFRTERAYLLDALKGAGISFDNDSAQAQIVEEARKYYWVQYRSAGTGPWSSAHPAWQGSPDAPSLEPLQVYTDSVPEDLVHRIRFEAYIEQEVAGETQWHIIVPAWERPAANLNGVPLTFSINSRNMLDLAKSGSKNLPDIATDLFIPSFSQASPAVAFKPSGSTVPIDAALSSFAGVFETVSYKTEKAVSALVGLGGTSQDDGDSVPAMELKSVNVRYTTIGPDGSEKSFERTVYDSDRVDDWVATAFGTDLGESLNRYAMLTRVFTIDISTGSSNPAYSFDRLLAQTISRQSSLEMMIALQHSGKLSELPTGPDGQSTSISWMGMPQVKQFYTGYPSQSPDTRLYQHQPGIVVHHRSLPFQERISESIDIVDFPQRGFDAQSGRPQLSAKPVLESGVWATIGEGEVLSNGRYLGWDTARAMSDARSSGAELKVLTSDDYQAVDGLKVDPAMKELIRRDINDGYVVAIPANVHRNPGSWAAWWRVNPRTGQALGVSPFGEGASLEKVMLHVGIYAGLMAGAACAGIAVGWGGEERLQKKVWTCFGVSVAAGCFAAGAVPAVLAAPAAAPATVPKIGAYCFATGMVIALGFNLGNVGTVD